MGEENFGAPLVLAFCAFFHKVSLFFALNYRRGQMQVMKRAYYKLTTTRQRSNWSPTYCLHGCSVVPD